jgi:hypothetical protein
MTSRRGRVAASALTAALLLTACSGGSDNPDDPKTPTQEASSMYCELINPKTVQPIVGSNTIKDFGGPVELKSEFRSITCNLYDSDDREDRLSVYEFELWSADAAQTERDKATAAMTKHAKDDPEHYVALKSDGDDLGYAWYTGDTAAANLLTDKRSISVTAPATAEQAAEFTPLMLKVAQEIDRNLDAWDAKNSS